MKQKEKELTNKKEREPTNKKDNPQKKKAIKNYLLKKVHRISD